MGAAPLKFKNIGIKITSGAIVLQSLGELLSSVQLRNTIVNAGPQYGIMTVMERARKITIEVPPDLLEKAQQASGAGITQTVRAGLQLVAASRTYARLRQLRGKVRFSKTVEELKADR
jgi:hypothetical protein